MCVAHVVFLLGSSAGWREMPGRGSGSVMRTQDLEGM